MFSAAGCMFTEVMTGFTAPEARTFKSLNLPNGYEDVLVKKITPARLFITPDK
jgi:hypothetical protein